jgi:hypothetical protein
MVRRWQGALGIYGACNRAIAHERAFLNARLGAALFAFLSKAGGISPHSILLLLRRGVRCGWAREGGWMASPPAAHYLALFAALPRRTCSGDAPRAELFH